MSFNSTKVVEQQCPSYPFSIAQVSTYKQVVNTCRKDIYMWLTLVNAFPNIGINIWLLLWLLGPSQKLDTQNNK